MTNVDTFQFIGIPMVLTEPRTLEPLEARLSREEALYARRGKKRKNFRSAFKPWAFSIFPLEYLPDLSTTIPVYRKSQDFPTL